MVEQTIAEVVSPQARKVNRFRRADGKVLVSQVAVAAESNLKERVQQAVDLIGGLARLVRPGDAIFVKPNFNSADPLPAATDREFLRAVLELIKDAGASQITVGEHCGRPSMPTRGVMEKLGIYELGRELGVAVLSFEEHDWVRVELNGRHVQSALMPRPAYEADKIIYLPCMKTHRLARFTLSLKVAFGFSHVSERSALHQNIEEKLVDLSLAWQPDLIIMDGRKAFVTDGPAFGTLVEPGVILASGDQIAMDVEALRILQSYPANNLLTLGAWEMPQIKAAIANGLGVASPAGYELVRA